MGLVILNTENDVIDKIGATDKIGFVLNGKPIEVVQENTLICPKCGVDRFKQLCPNGATAALTDQCPMKATAQ